MRPSLPLASAVILALLAGCGADSTPEISGPTDAMITAAAKGSGVPRDLMVAVAHIEGGLGLASIREVESDDAVPVAGVLELRHGRYNSLARGAALMGLPEVDLQIDLAKGTEAGARVLDDLARDHAIPRADLADWAEVVEELSGHRSRAQQIAYRAEVFHLLRHGGTVRARGGEAIVLPAHEEIPLDLTWAPPPLQPQGTPEYPGAIWFETPQANKWTSGRDTPVTMIAVHDTEGGWNASVSTLQNDPGKSVHYILSADGSKVGQFISEGDTGWHAGNWFYNQRMIGIEHVGYAGLDDYQTPLYARSADLVRSIAKRNKLGPHKDGTDLARSVLVGHQEVPDGVNIAKSSPPCSLSPGACVKSPDYGGANHHRDPGVNWEWCQYMNLIGDGASCKCNDAFDHFNCVHDLSAMVRCPSGTVEYVQCPGGCVGMPNGVDDVCAANPGATSSSSASATSSSASSATTGAGAVSEGLSPAAPPSPGKIPLSPRRPLTPRLFPLFNSHEHDGNVVLPAMIIGEINQARARLGEHLPLAHHRRDLRVGHQRMKPVGAEEVHVAGLGSIRAHVEIHRRPDAERAGDHVARQIREIALAQIGALDQRVGDERVIARELVELAVAHAVAAAVPRVGDVERVIPGIVGRGDDRRPHAPVSAGVVGAGEDPRVGQRHRGAEVAPYVHVVAGAAAEVRGDDARGHPARHLPRLVTPHPVGDNEDVELRQQDETVLVMGTLPTDVAQSRRDRTHSGGF